VPIERQRAIAQKLVEITMHAFRLRPQERYQVSIEFISEPKSNAGNCFGLLSKRDADCIFEVMGRDLTEEKKRAFAEETAAFVAPLLHSKIEDAYRASAGSQAGRVSPDCFSVLRTQPGSQRTVCRVFRLAGSLSS
jgi:hypothetical protein